MFSAFLLITIDAEGLLGSELQITLGIILNQVEDDLDRIKNASSQQELMNSFKDFGRSLMDLNETAGKRQGVSTTSLNINIAQRHQEINGNLTNFVVAGFAIKGMHTK